MMPSTEERPFISSGDLKIACLRSGWPFWAATFLCCSDGLREFKVATTMTPWGFVTRKVLQWESLHLDKFNGGDGYGLVERSVGKGKALHIPNDGFKCLTREFGQGTAKHGRGEFKPHDPGTRLKNVCGKDSRAASCVQNHLSRRRLQSSSKSLRS